jgi:hypothetical protein
VARTSRLFVGLLAALAFVGCDRFREPGDRNQEIVDNAVPRIERALGLPFKTPPQIDVRTREEVRAFLTGQLDEPHAAEHLAGQEAAMHRFGLIPETMSLRALLLDVLEEQVAGYYDPRANVLYVVEGATPEILNITVTHELIHALQDQYLDLDSLQRSLGNDDRQSAAHAVLEGQATFEQLRLTVGQDIGTMLPGGWGQMRELIRQQQAQMPRFAAAPIAIQEMLIFPYLSGAEFIRRFREHRPGQNPLEHLPTSTEQVMHMEKYFEERDEPIAVTLPPLLTGQRITDNTLGEFATRLFLYEHMKNQNDAIRGAMGWGGDRYVVFDVAGGKGLAWVTVWDTAIDAGVFHDLLGRTMTRRFGRGSARTIPSAGGFDGIEYVSGGRRVAISTGEIGGHPAVIWVDVPEAGVTRVMDLSSVTAERGAEAGVVVGRP